MQRLLNGSPIRQCLLLTLRNHKQLIKGKNAAYPKAIDELKTEKELPLSVELWQNKYLNNRVEQSTGGKIE